MSKARVVLIHGAATTPAVYRAAAALLAPVADVTIPSRPCSGSLEVELEALRATCRGAVVVGVSGGATLALALAEQGLAMRKVLAHEPALGSWVPGLLDDARAAWSSEGLGGFGRALYGPSWQVSMSPDEHIVARDLDMFSAYQPTLERPLPMLVTSVGEQSNDHRFRVAQTLQRTVHAQKVVFPHVGHALHIDAPDLLAGWVTRYLRESLTTETDHEGQSHGHESNLHEH